MHSKQWTACWLIIIPGSRRISRPTACFGRRKGHLNNPEAAGTGQTATEFGTAKGRHSREMNSVGAPRGKEGTTGAPVGVLFLYHDKKRMLGFATTRCHRKRLLVVDYPQVGRGINGYGFGSFSKSEVELGSTLLSNPLFQTPPLCWRRSLDAPARAYPQTCTAPARLDVENNGLWTTRTFR